MPAPSRTEQRQHWPDSIRLAQLETDVDTMERGQRETNEQLSSVHNLLRTVLISVVTLTLALIGNLIVLLVS